VSRVPQPFQRERELKQEDEWNHHPPVTPRVHQAADPTHEFLVESSFLEIYNEKVLDLLEPSTDPDTLKIRESPQLGVHVVGLTKRHVKSATEVVRTLITGFMVSVFL
jgi:hypothetical protein